MNKKLLKPLSFVPALLVMLFIFSMSAKTGEASGQMSYKIAYKVVEAGGFVFGSDLTEEQTEEYASLIHTPIRKLAHMAEYFILAVCVSFPLYVYGMRGMWLMFFAGAICVLFACGDEYHQSFVDGRGPSKRDVLIDSAGVFLGIILVRIVCWCARHMSFKKDKKFLRPT